jgi:hypothetical protein
MDKAFNGTSVPLVHDLGDGTHALVVTLLGGDVGGGGTGTTVDREYVVFDWTVKTAVTGAVVGDTLKQYVWYDASGTTLVKQFEQWTNKGVLLATAPTLANLEFKDVSTTGTTKTVSQVAYQVKTTFGGVSAGTYLNKVSVFDTAVVSSINVYWFTAGGVALDAADVALLVEGTNTIAQSEQVDARMVDSTGALITQSNPLPVATTALADVTGTNNLLVGTSSVSIDVKDFDQFVFTATYNNFSGNDSYAAFIGSAEIFAVVNGVAQKIQFYDASKSLQVSLNGSATNGVIRTSEIDSLRFTYAITAGSITLNWAKKSKVAQSVVLEQNDTPGVTGTLAATNQVVAIELFGANSVTVSALQVNSGGGANINMVFQYSPNSTNGTDGNWYGVQAARSDSNTAETFVNLSTVPSYNSEFSTRGMKWARVRCNSASGTNPSATLTLKRSYGAGESIPIIQYPANQQVTIQGTQTGMLALQVAMLNNNTFAANTTNTVTLLSYGTFDTRCYYGAVTVPVGVTLSLKIQETQNTTNTQWLDRYALPDIVGTGAQTFIDFPPLKGPAGIARLVWTTTGPSAVTGVYVYLKETPFNYPIVRGNIFKNFALNSGTSATASLYAPECTKFEFGVMGYTIAAAASIQLQTSFDNVTWVSVGTPFAMPIGTNISTRQSVMDFLGPYVRLVVTTPSGSVTSSGQAFIRAME